MTRMSGAAATLLKLFGPKALDAVKKSIGKLTADDKKLLRAYARLIDERRVFYTGFHGEVVEMCVSSIDWMKNETDKTVAQIENTIARAAVREVATACREFIERWHNAVTPRFGARVGDDGDHLSAFFQHLGSLRQRVQDVLGVLKMFDKSIAAPNIEAWKPEADADG